MLSTNRLRSIYSRIQAQLFYMIPEKWEKIYLYASIIEQVNHLETGEMFFYYYPAGLLKKKPVNVYEIPNKFNIEEEEYLQLVNKLYSTINELRDAFKDSKEEKMWTNLTIIIGDSKFTVEYNYEDLIGSEFTSYDRHLIWQCKYLEYPLERLSGKDKKTVKEYFMQEKPKIKTYTEGMYKKNEHNIIEYKNEHMDEEDDDEDEQIKEQKRIEKMKYQAKRKNDKYEQYKQKQEMKKQRELQKIKVFEKELENETKDKRKNQILNV